MNDGIDADIPSTIVQTLTELTGATEIFTQQQLDPHWQTQLNRAIAPNTAAASLVFPSTVAELATVVTCAHQQGWHILPCGSGSKLDWGGLLSTPHSRSADAHGGSPLPTPHAPLIAVSAEHLDRLIDHAVGDLTVTVEAGMRFAQLQAILAEAGQFLAIDPAYPDQATIGGIVATADTGSLRHRYNSVRDMLLGISFIRADGETAKAGGRVVKNVAGYDLMKLFTGSFGTLGILTQLTFRVYPLPEASETIALSGESAAVAQLIKPLLKSALTPVSLDLVSPSVATLLGLGSGIGAIVRFQSSLPSVQQQVSQVVELGRSLGLQQTRFAGEDDATLWQGLLQRTIERYSEGAIACKIGVEPAKIVPLLHEIQQLLPTSFIQLHAASGLGRLHLPTPTTPDIVQTIRHLCQNYNGFLTLLQAPIELKQAIEVWGYNGTALTVMRQIKQAFDPENRLSPNRFVV